MILFLIITSVLLITTLVVIYNFFSAPELKTNSLMEEMPLISILIPARNEENNISHCLEKILNQRYNNFEVFVLDDKSTDNTRKLIESFTRTQKDKRIKLLNGKNLPENWTGKNWACHQLSENAKGELLLFIDADVMLSPDALIKASSVFVAKNCSLLTLFPSQKNFSLGEFLTVPLMNWFLLTFLPLKLVYSNKNVSFTAANGQFMLWNKSAYQKIGGHKVVAHKIVEDMEIARLTKKNGDKVYAGLGGEEVFCRMYNSFNDGFVGFSKNFFPGFAMPKSVFILSILFLFFVFYSPFIFVFFYDEYFLPAGLIIGQRFLISLKSKQNFLINILLHPLQMLIMLIVGIYSALSVNKGKIYWKGRKL